MTKLASLVQLGLALVLLLPVYATRPQSADALRGKLAATAAALDELARIETRIASRDASAIEDLLAITEPPLDCGEAPSARDDLLESLRAEVGALSAAVESGEAPAAMQTAAADAAAHEPGLDEAWIRALAVAAPRPAERAAAAAAPARAPRAFEAEGYVADALRLARASMRAGKSERALELFALAGDSPEARHGRAQCLEKLGRYAEALAAYEQVAAASDAGPWAARAAEDREFLAWRLEFERAVSARRNER